MTLSITHTAPTSRLPTSRSAQHHHVNQSKCQIIIIQWKPPLHLPPVTCTPPPSAGHLYLSPGQKEEGIIHHHLTTGTLLLIVLLINDIKYHIWRLIVHLLRPTLMWQGFSQPHSDVSIISLSLSLCTLLWNAYCGLLAVFPSCMLLIPIGIWCIGKRDWLMPEIIEFYS